MSFIELILKVTDDAIEVAHIQFLIDNRVEENLHLDYKSIRVFDDTDALAKSVSSFANSDGGLLILGVEEERSSQNSYERIFPTKIEWGGVRHSKENLEQRLMTNISPAIRDLRIYPVRDGNQVIFVLDIPQSEDPPHMASDHRYYFRNNFTTSVMEHYQVADLFGRRRHPELELKCEFKFASTYPGEDKRIDLTTELVNVGRTDAKNWLVIIEVSGARAEGKDFIPKWEFVQSTDSVKLVKQESQQLVYTGLPVLLGNLSFRLKVGDKMTMNFFLASEEMDLIKDRWERSYEDFEWARPVPYVVRKKGLG